MNLMEYQGKELFKRAGIPVPRSGHAVDAHQVADYIEKTVGEWVVKAQVLMGGRGKAGKIKFANTADEGRSVATDILATPMPPNRQNPKGELINS
ncbi:MAG: succinate--CoA ligase subunit beta, partial [Candidatus Eremiobacteraeota bacterium]|nr:succinate--CoA ligase subunit beta [Candidatus Eremiobacteraeota bacterium]